jgi:hypothetical protein
MCHPSLVNIGRLHNAPSSHHATMTSRLERLPVELFEFIAVHLDLSAYKSLRLVSHRSRFLIHSLFVELAFSRLKTTLGSPSLRRLVNVAQSPHLHNAVKVIQIQLLTSSDYHVLAAISRVGRYPPPKRFPSIPGIQDKHIKEEAPTFAYVVQSKYPNQLYEGLVRALRGFTNLTAIHFHPRGSQITESRDLLSKDDCIFRSKCFQVVIDAIIHSEVRLSEFRMAKCKRGTALHKEAILPFSTLQLPAQSLKALHHRFSHLKVLTISALTVYDDVSRIHGWQNGIANIIATAPKLKSFTLSLDRSNYVAAIIHNMIASFRSLELEILQLMFCALHGDDLVAIVKSQSATLRRAVFSDLRLMTGTWPSVLHALKECERLEHVRLSSLSGVEHPIRRLDVSRENRAMMDMLDELIVTCDIRAVVPNPQGSGFVETHHHTALSLARISTTIPSE